MLAAQLDISVLGFPALAPLEEALWLSRLLQNRLCVLKSC